MVFILCSCCFRCLIFCFAFHSISRPYALLPVCFLKTNILCWASRSWKGYKAKWKNRAFFAPNTLPSVLGNREVQPPTAKGLLLCQSCRCLWPNIPMSFLRPPFYETFLRCDLFFSSLCENEAFLLFFSFSVCVPNHLAVAVLTSLYT